MDENCLFCKMATGAIPIEKLHDDEHVFAIRDINPRAPIHVLIIPKEHIPDGRALTTVHGDILGRMFALSARLADADGLAQRGYRLAFNVGEDAGMTIPHLHLHLIGGRHLGAEG